MSDPWDWGRDEIVPQSDRLGILSPEEYELLWGQPQFSDADRVLFFALTPQEVTLFRRLRTARTKVHFLLQLGYFRARQRFFFLNLDAVADDLAYIYQHHLDGIAVRDLAVSKHTRQRHIQWILDRF